VFKKQVEFTSLQDRHNPPEMMLASGEVRKIFSHIWGSILL